MSGRSPLPRVVILTMFAARTFDPRLMWDAARRESTHERSARTASYGGRGRTPAAAWRFSLIWAIPIVTAAVGAWLAWDTLSQRGPLITITFQTAEGLQAGQSHVRYKAVDMGAGDQIALTERPAACRGERADDAARPTSLLTEQHQFWVVKPRFFAGSISGLETLFSGAYIGMLPVGSPAANEQKIFTGLEDPPVLQSDEPGHTFLLQARRVSATSISARRSTIVTSPSARYWAGTSATWRTM